MTISEIYAGVNLQKILLPKTAYVNKEIDKVFGRNFGVVILKTVFIRSLHCEKVTD